MMKRTKKKIAFSVIGVVLIAAVVALCFVLRNNDPVNVGDVTPTESVNDDKNVTKKPTATEVPNATEEPSVTGEPVEGVDGTPVPTLDPSVEVPVEGDDVTPVPTVAPVAPDIIPAPTFAPTATPTVGATATPKPTAKPTVTPKPTATPKPTKVTAEYFYTELAKICSIDPENAVEGLKERGIIPSNIDTDGKVVREDAFVVMKNAAEYLKLPSDAELYDIVTYYERLSDVNNLTAEEKAAAYYLYANGIVDGVSDGDYTRTRSIEPKNELSKEETDLYLARMIGAEEKRVLSPDGQITRESDLRNMDLYPYILESIPDAFYTRAFQFMLYYDMNTGKSAYESGYVESDGKVWTDGGGMYASPVMLKKMYGENGTSGYFRPIYVDATLEEDVERIVEEYLMKVFNVDYHTTPKDANWKADIMEMLDGSRMGIDVEKYNSAEIDAYLDLMKSNHTVIECDMVRAEGSTISETMNQTHIRCYVHYRVVSYDSDENVYLNTNMVAGEMSPLVYTFTKGNWLRVDLHDLKAGEWRDGYFDVALGGNAVKGLEPIKILNVEMDEKFGEHSITDY